MMGRSKDLPVVLSVTVTVFFDAGLAMLLILSFSAAKLPVGRQMADPNIGPFASGFNQSRVTIPRLRVAERPQIWPGCSVIGQSVLGRAEMFRSRKVHACALSSTGL